MNSPFATILLGQDRSLVIGENAHFIAVLEKKPLVLGHVVVIAKRNEDALYDLPDEELATLLVFSKRIAQAMKAVIACQKIGTAVLGLETRHAHLHLVPISSADDLNFTRAKLSPSEEELKKVRDQIKASL
jgi:histidine triad (HIT) family protein